MKQKNLFLIFLLAFLPLVAYADAVEIDGIYYNLNADNHTAEVTSNPNGYSDDVVIPETVMYSDVNYGVTSIGNQAFDGCRNMTSVTIPNSVTSIGNFAFCNCFGLTSVTIPNSVTSIGDNAFNCCFDLTSLTISNSVKSIGEKAFFSCNSLTSIVVEDGNTIYDSRDNSNALIETATNTLIVGCQNTIIPNSVTSIGECAFIWCNNLLKIEIPSTITSIGDGAFVSSPSATTVPTIISHITEPFAINGNVFGSSKSWPSETTDPSSATLYVPVGTKAKYEAFVGWTQFKEIVEIGEEIPDEEYTDEQGVKYTLNDDGQTYSVSGHTDACTGAIIIPETVNGCSVTNILGGALSGCTGLTSITIPNSVTSIGEWAFAGCSSLTSITIPNSVTSIGGLAFNNCSGLTSITIPNSVTSIGGGAFFGCSGLTSITIPKSVVYFYEMLLPNFYGGEFSNPFDGNMSSLIVEEGNPKYDSRDNCNAIIETATNTLIAGGNMSVIPNSVTSIGDHAFMNCSGLTSVTIPNSVTSIGQFAFDGCGLTSLVIPASVTHIGGCAFSGNSGLTDVYCYAENVPTTADDAFGWYPGAIVLHVPAGSVIAYSNAAPWKDFKEIVSIEEYTDDQGVKYTFNAQGSYTVSGYTDACEGEIIIPETVNGYSVTSIRSGAFNYCTGMTSITIPQSVTLISIGVGVDYPYSPFFDCKNLSNIVVEEGNPVYDSRDNCNAIIETATNKLLIGCKNTIIPNNVTSVGDFAFIGCEGLISITIPKSVTAFGFALHTCTGLTSIIVEEGNPVYDSRDNCNAIIETATNTLIAGCKNTTIPNNVKTIDYNAFVGCSGLTSVKIPNSVTLIRSWSLGATTGLTDVYCYAEKVPTVEVEAFAYSNIANATLHVPEGCIEAYKATEPWNEFKEIVAIEDEEETTEDVIKITSARQTTWCSAYDLDFSNVEGLKAYTATGYHRTKGTIWLTRVKEVPAGEGILLIGDEGEYKVPHKSTTAYYANLMVGTVKAITINETDGEYTNYYLSNGDSGVGFYKVNGSVDIKANRAYLPLLKNTVSGSRGFIGMDFDDDEDGTTGIEVQSSIFNVQSKDVYYNLQGLRVDKPGKGVFIRNGKKVVIK